MEVRSLQKTDLERLYEFNQRVFADRNLSFRDYINFWISKSNAEVEKNIVLVDDNNNIHGEILTSTMSYYYEGKETSTVWLYDLFVEEELRRKTSWGIDVIMECLERHPKSCSIGSNDVALPIHLKIGNKMLGEMRKYVGITNPFGLLSSLFRGNIKAEVFPNEIVINNRSYNRLSIDSLPDLNRPYNNDLWEISRNRDFLKWRFFSGLHQYAFYKDSESEDFFVVRTIVKSKITALLLVDYRCDVSNESPFENIFQAIKCLMKKLHLGLFVAGSSLAMVDSVLEKHYCKSIGRPHPIIGFVNIKNKKSQIEERNFSFVTMADSDGETDVF